MRRTEQQRAIRGSTNRIKGFTIVELLVAMAIFGLVLGAIYSVVISSNKSYHTQDRVVDLQQGLRVGLDFMVRDIRMAGLNPRGVGGFGIQEATAIKIRFASDSDWTTWDSDNDLPADDEIITYEYSTVDADCDNNAPCLRRGIGSSGSESWQVLIENVDAVNGVDFQYLDAGDNPLTLPVSALDLPNIRTVVVSLVAQDTNAEGQTFNRTLRARIRCRNL